MVKYNKLVRDKIPDLIKEDNKVPIIKILNEEEYLDELDRKLEEEVKEYLQSGNVEELSDIVDLVFGILNAKDIPYIEFERISRDKANKNGVFDDRIFLKEVVEEDSNFLFLFIEIVKTCQINNTYKLALAKSLVELAYESDYSTEKISLFEISKKFIKYYWNQLIKNDFKQGQRTPRVIDLVKDLMESYSSSNHMTKFDNAENILEHELKSQYEKCLKNIVAVLKKDVIERFPVLNHEKFDIYEYQKGNDYLILNLDKIFTLKSNKNYLIKLIEYRWGLVIDSFNGIIKGNKIKGTMKTELLKRYRDYF